MGDQNDEEVGEDRVFIIIINFMEGGPPTTFTMPITSNNGDVRRRLERLKHYIFKLFKAGEEDAILDNTLLTSIQQDYTKPIILFGIPNNPNPIFVDSEKVSGYAKMQHDQVTAIVQRNCCNIIQINEGVTMNTTSEKWVHFSFSTNDQGSHNTHLKIGLWDPTNVLGGKIHFTYKDITKGTFNTEPMIGSMLELDQPWISKCRGGGVWTGNLGCPFTTHDELSVYVDYNSGILNIYKNGMLVGHGMRFTPTTNVGDHPIIMTSSSAYTPCDITVTINQKSEPSDTVGSDRERAHIKQWHVIEMMSKSKILHLLEHFKNEYHESFKVSNPRPVLLEKLFEFIQKYDVNINQLENQLIEQRVQRRHEWDRARKQEQAQVLEFNKQRTEALAREQANKEAELRKKQYNIHRDVIDVRDSFLREPIFKYVDVGVDVGAGSETETESGSGSGSGSGSIVIPNRYNGPPGARFPVESDDDDDVNDSTPQPDGYYGTSAGGFVQLKNGKRIKKW